MHGGSVVVVRGLEDSGQQADALVTVRDDLALMVRTADCAPIALASPEGVVAVAHGGWRGLLTGVVEATAQAMRDLGARQIHAGLGPCIRPCCYEFGLPELDRVAAVFGEGVRATATGGGPALDLPALVAAAVDRAGAELVFASDECTGCQAGRFWSHRARGELERQGVLAWLN